jgi:signal recognition particle subunit SRP9
MYKTFSSIILNRFEALNLRLLSQIANVRPKARPINTGSGAGTPAAVADEDDPMLGTGATDAAKGVAGSGIERTGTPAGGSKAGGGGGKKKKKGKK